MGAQRAIRCFRLLAFLTFSFTASASAQTTIGLYSDASGSSCSISGNDPGLLQAYVVVRPGAAGVSGVRFAAPVPACLGSIYLGDSAADGMFIVGDSQTGISVAAGQCFSEPTHVLTINYFRSGSTAACCAYAIGSDPFTGLVEATTCAQATITATPVTSHFNADASCPCADDVAPLPPSNPFPLHETIHAFLWPTMTWQAIDWDGDIAEYDVYFGTSTTPPLAVTGLTSPAWEHGPLNPFTTYYWRVVVRDALGHETSGPVWYFTTRGPNSPPVIQLISPVNNFNFSPFGTMTWTASDPNGDPILYDVYLGTTSPPPFVGRVSTQSYKPLGLQYATHYYWRVVATDEPHSETSTLVAEFITSPNNAAPLPPFDPDPADTELLIDTSLDLQWSAEDPAHQVVTCDLQLGEVSPPPLVAQNIIRTGAGVFQYSTGSLTPGVRHYWRILVRDSDGLVTSGPIWSFVPGAVNHPPAAPSSPNPPNGATLSPTGVRLQWVCSDQDGHNLTYDVYFGESDPPPFLVTTTNPDVPVGPLSTGHHYFWKVIASDGFDSTQGPTWSFSAGTPNNPPSAPSSPNPANTSTVTNASLNLQWSASDPDGNPLTYQVYFGASNPPPFLVATSSRLAPVGPLAKGQYFWQVIASDGIASTPGPVWTFNVDFPLPVLFSNFGATVSGTAARLDWELKSDEAMQSYTIYRSADKGTPVALTTASVFGTTGSFLDRTVEGGKTYRYEMVVKAASGDEYRSQASTVSMPVFALALEQNHPNPFNPQTTIPYTLPASNAPVRVRLIIYDASGRTVRVLVDEDQSGGAREVVWRGDDASGAAVSSGIYFCVLQAGKERRTQKLVLLK